MCYNILFEIKGGEFRLLVKDHVMAIDDQKLPELVKEIRRQLSLSQEDLARELGISFVTVNRWWENCQVKPSKLAKTIRQGKLKLPVGDR